MLVECITCEASIKLATWTYSVIQSLLITQILGTKLWLATLDNNADNNKIAQASKQTVDKCLDNSNCENDSTNNAKVTEANDNRIVQVNDQDINCRASPIVQIQHQMTGP